MILDFVLTTVGIAAVGPMWEMNPLYRSLWENEQFLTYIGYWVLAVLGYSLIMYLFARGKELFRTRPHYGKIPKVLTALILYFSFQKLYFGAIGWSITLGCDYFSSINGCIAYISSNPGLSLLFAVLNLVFPASI